MSALVEEVARLERIEHEARYTRRVIQGVLEELAKGISVDRNDSADRIQEVRVDLMAARTSLDLALKEN